MVIVRLSTGLANQAYEYAAAYAVSKELKTELILDISECLKSPKGFLLDYFNIPNKIKVFYEPIDAEGLGHAAIHGIPDAFLDGKTILTDLDVTLEGYDIMRYKDIRQLKNISADKDIYMCGYFMNKEQYFKKYWREIRKSLVLRKDNIEVNSFKKEIINKNTVGIHIRRGDFLYEDWPERMPDNYFKAAVVLLEIILKRPCFYVFSDDIEYAKKILGNKRNIRFIHFTGYQDADLAEFICLSQCRHKIISNSSTFSQLADELGNYPERILVKKANHLSHWENNIFELSNNIINCLAKFYFIGHYKRRKILNNVKFKQKLEKIANYTINSFDITPEKWQKLSLLKMKELTYRYDWTAVLQAAFPIYYRYRGNEQYDLLLINALIHIGAHEEALIESIRMGGAGYELLKSGNLYKNLSRMQNGKYIIVPSCKCSAASFPVELVEMGIILSHLGNEVLYILEPVNASEEKYIENNQYFINHKGIIMGGRQISFRKASEIGLELLLKKERSKGIANYIISRKSEVLSYAKSNGYIGFFYDYSYKFDAEKKYANDEKVKECINYADYIISHNFEMRQNFSNCIYVEMPEEENFTIEKNRWDICRENRMSKRYIHIIAKMGEVL